ncbi:DMT family transporter [Phormidium sp. CCY1219]|uniref:DMT family transporter n=1 Tax=Phormidium sp. CCY1219 TaxID=2886104 RepID=UPI002D784753|nr:DMT family transporter [Phormidium sp. CCY1219]
MTNKLELPQLQIKPTSVLMAFLSLSIALIAVSFAAIFIRWMELELGPNATIFNRLWIASVVLGGWTALNQQRARLTDETLTREKRSLTREDFWLLIAVGTVASTSLGFWAWSLTQTRVANSTVLRNLTPIFTCLGGWLIWGRRFDGRFLSGMAIALVGAIALGVSDLQIATENFLGDAAALVSAMFYGINLLIVEQLRGKLPASRILLWRCAIGTLLTLPIVLCTETRVFPASPTGWLSAIALAVICQAIGQGLLVHSLKRLSAAFVAIALLLEPILTTILAWIFFAEQLTFSNGLAFAVVLVGIYLAKSSQSTQKA